MSASDVTPPLPSVDELEGAIRTFSSVLEELQTGHVALAARAERVEAELGRTNAELAARLAELDAVTRHLEAILSSLPTGVVVRDAAGRVVRINESALEILGTSAPEVIGRKDIPGLAGGPASDQPREFQRSDGERLVLTNRYSPIRLEDGEVTGSVEILDDRTALEAMARRVHRLDKMAALGTMAGGIAHEIRNPLHAVRGFASLLGQRLAGESKEAHWAKRIQEGVDECNAIVTSMLTFADPERLNSETIHCEDLVDDALRTVRADLLDDDGPSYSITADVEPISFVGDRIKLRQCVRNLVANAIDAQPRGGSIHVASTRDGDDVLFSVTDAGPGIPVEDLHRITDPFFTTHADGTGLGLALVHTIARLHGGTFEVLPDASPLGGADARLSIPLAPQSTSR